MKAEPNPAVLSWLRRQNQAQIALTSITLAEIYDGLKKLPDGKRKDELHYKFSTLIDKGFQDRIFDFDAQSADVYGDITSLRQKKGLHVDAFDMMIASIALVHHCDIATRNISDFQGCELQLIDPFAEI